MSLKKIWLKITDKNKYYKYKYEGLRKNKEALFKNKIKNLLEIIEKKIKTKEEISFLHSGHLGDLINALPVIKEISKTKRCNYFIEANKKIPEHIKFESHPFGNVYLSDASVKMVLPLLKRQSYLNIADEFKNQNIDVNLNLFRDLPINFNIDSIRWYSHLTGVHPDLSKSYIEADDNELIKDKIVIMRSLRRQNYLINYKFLSDYKDILFLGLKKEFLDLKKDMSNLKFHDCKNFLEMTEIIKNSKIFIGNLSFGYTLAEGLKIPRLLESNPEFPLVYPNGGKGYDFYYQNHFEKMFKKLYLNN